MGMQLVQQPVKITILYDHDHQVRQVRMNQPHPPQLTPAWYGDSVGRYDWYGTPYTEALHVIERYRLIEYEAAKEAEERGTKENLHMPLRMSGATGLAAAANYKGKALQLQFTVEDEGVFTMPWSATITYWRSFDQWREFVCAESLRATYVVEESAIPRADRPDF
jgi:hypothetical protein